MKVQTLYQWPVRLVKGQPKLAAGLGLVMLALMVVVLASPASRRRP